MHNAIGYGCWNMARLPYERGARVDRLWRASALSLLDRLEQLLQDPANATQPAINQAFWHACAAGKRRAAEFLVQRGADLAFTPAYGHGSVLDVASNQGTQRSNVIAWLEEIGVQSKQD